MIDPTICKYWKKNGFTKVWRGPEEYSVVIGENIYVPYQFAYDRILKEYVWKFKRGDVLAGISVS